MLDPHDLYDNHSNHSTFPEVLNSIDVRQQSHPGHKPLEYEVMGADQEDTSFLP